jgi:hypothetical protein
VFDFDHYTLKTAFILPERPEVGADACLATDSLPSLISIRVNVVDIGTVVCAIEQSAVRALSTRRAPTWGDLQRVWQALAEIVDRKIRAAEFDPGRRHRDRPPVVRIASADVDAGAGPISGSRQGLDAKPQPERGRPV